MSRKKCVGSACACLVIACIVLAIAIPVSRRQNKSTKDMGPYAVFHSPSYKPGTPNVPVNKPPSPPAGTPLISPVSLPPPTVKSPLGVPSPPSNNGVLSVPYPWLMLTMGEEELEVDKDILTFNMDPSGKNSRITSSWTSTEGTLCADIMTAPGINPGTVFAMYLITKEPQDRNADVWWELDFEFLGKRPDAVWVNVFSNGKPDRNLEKSGNYIGLPHDSNSDYHRYCINWDTSKKKANWTVDGYELYSYGMDDTWTEPMRAVFSYWVGVPEWTGASELSSRISTHVKNIKYTTVTV